MSGLPPGVAPLGPPHGHNGRCFTVRYHGPELPEAHGAALLRDDCNCGPCSRLEPWDPYRVYELTLPARGTWENGRILHHVAAASFTCTYVDERAEVKP